MLTILERQTYLKKLGYYKGELDGLEGPQTKAAYKAFQKDHGLEADGIYGKLTNAKLKEEYREKFVVNWSKSKYFKKSEFKCNCGGRYCDGYPAEIDPQLVINLNKTREEFGVPITITSGLRCVKYNNSLAGSSKTSKHMTGKAADFIVPKVGVSLGGRRRVMTYWKSLEGSSYTYCNENGSHPNMGNAIHGDVE